MRDTGLALIVMAGALNVWSTVVFVWTRRERRRLQDLRDGLSGRPMSPRKIVNAETLEQAIDRLRGRRSDTW